VLEMITITKKEWERIPADYKGIWTREIKDNGWQPNLPEEYIGKRTMMGTGENIGQLLTESVHFEIID
jgi:hypothetical protein